MNLSFLNPYLLWALPSALIPLILHLYFKRKKKKIEFSDLYFIRLALKKVQTGYKIRQYLVLLLRTLIIILIVLFFSRPEMNYSIKSGENRDESSVSVIILMDVSYSMRFIENGKSRFENNRSYAKKIVSILPSSARIGIVAYSDIVEFSTPCLSNDKEYLKNVIDGIEISGSTTNLGPALKTSLRLLEERALSNRTIVILSDLCENGFRDNSAEIDEKVNIVIFPAVEGENNWLSKAEAVYQKNGNDWQIDVSGMKTIKNGYTKMPVNLFVGKTKTAGGFASINKSGKFNHSMFYPGTRESINGYFEISPDNLNYDNRIYFSADKQEKYKIWIVDGDAKFGGVSAESYFLRKAFPSAIVITEEEVGETDFKKPGVVILANVRESRKEIEDFISSGGGAVIFLGEHYSEMFNPPYLPADVGNLFEKNNKVNWISGTEVFNNEMRINEYEWQKIAIEKGFTLKLKKNSRTIASMESGWPFIVEGRFGEGSVIMFASSADRDWNNLVSRPLYVPFIQLICDNAVNSSVSEKENQYFAGMRIKFNRYDEPIIKTPSGKNVKPIISGSEMVFGDTGDTGIYTLFSQGVEIKSFAINHDPRSGESGQKTITVENIKNYFKKNLIINMPEKKWESKFLAIFSGTEISGFIILCAMALLLLESILANRIFREADIRKQTDEYSK